MRSRLLLLIFAVTLLLCCDSGKTYPPRVLVFSKTTGWKHTCIPFGIAAIQKLGQENNFAVDTTKNAQLFTDDNLKQYHAVIFNSTTRNVLNAEQQAAFERYIQAGGGYVGIHAAADTEYEWPWYNKLVGAYFSSHPHNSNVRKATVNVTDKTHISTSGLPDKWERTDEWYNYKSIYPDLKILAYLDESTYVGGTNGDNHPIAWYHEFDGGRAFYTGGGHEDSSYSEPLFLSHLLGGIKYAMGDGKLDYSKATAVTMPEENRFVKTTLSNGLNTPMELDITNDGRIFFSELRTANLYMFDTKTNRQSLVHQFEVCTKGGTGLIGVTLDPDFSSNNYIYLYYSPPTGEEPIYFNLSRFTVKKDNTLDTDSEKVLLRVPVQENSGAHHGGSLAWDKDGNLFISTGDSSSPFPAGGYAPLDERPGKEFYSLDAQRGASNTNDFKGKVLRIHPEADGTYTIPEGNLFPKGTDKTLPEIYAMGCRNPYRIAVNPKTSVLYWGEIGPDAGKDSLQGPRGYDEFNQAKKAGNFGWPYFVGNNQAYNRWDFANNKPGEKFNPSSPVNNSPNNTGLNQLPPAQSAMIWYPYAASKEFPELGQGGRSAMAGEFYTFDKNSTSPNKFPEYFDGSLFVFDWMRNWVMAIRFDKGENFLKNEPFMASADFRRPIDLTFGKDGVMYMLEYGSVYGAINDDARLVKIEYNTGNRAPIAKASIQDSAAAAHRDKIVFLTSERRLPYTIRHIEGEAPLRVLFSSNGTNDPDDDDKYTYEWLFDGKTVGSTEANPKYTFTKPGTYQTILRVTDSKGATGMDTLVVKAGNDAPQVIFATSNNKSFYFPKKNFSYAVKASDTEDKVIDPKQIKVTLDYNPSPGTKSDDDEEKPLGLQLILASDCKACHQINKISVGPSYTAVSERYKGKANALNQLVKKVIAGGGGVWDKEHVMSAHPQLAPSDVKEMVNYILSLANKGENKKALATASTLTFSNEKKSESGVYTLHASYTDKGANGIGPLTTTETIRLQNARVLPRNADQLSGFQRYGDYISNAGHNSFVLLKNVDLTGITKFMFEYSSENRDGILEARIDSQGGAVIASSAYKATGTWDKTSAITAKITAPQSGKHDVYFFILKRDKPNNDIISLKSITFGE